jgi:hypothetical protein
VAKKSGKQNSEKKSEIKTDFRSLARSRAAKVFERLLEQAESSDRTVAALQARKEVLELAGVEDVTADYVIDLKLIEISQDDNGNIVEVKREAPNLDSKLPLQCNEKIAKQLEQK